MIADIHFDYRLALAALEAGVDGLRLNPGNISDPDQIAAVVKSAKERKVPIRIGVNAGSLPKKPARGSVAQRMVAAALEQIDLLESLDFDLIKISLKAFDVPTTVEAYRLWRGRRSIRCTWASLRPDCPERDRSAARWASASCCTGHRGHHPRLAHRRPAGRSCRGL